MNWIKGRDNFAKNIKQRHCKGQEGEHPSETTGEPRENYKGAIPARAGKWEAIRPNGTHFRPYPWCIWNGTMSWRFWEQVH